MPISKLRAAIEDLGKTVSYTREQSADKPLSYNSKLYKVLNGHKAVKIEKIDKSIVERTKALWEKSVDSEDYTQLSSRSVAILCSIQELLTDNTFLKFIQSNRHLLRPRAIRFLLTSHHNFWKKNVYYDLVSNLLTGIISNYSGSNRIMTAWKENIDFILGDDSTDLLALRLIESRKDIDEITSDFNLLVPNSEFSKEILTRGCFKLTDKIENSNHLNDNDWNYLLNFLLQKDIIVKSVREAVLARLIIHSDSLYQGEDLESTISRIKDFLLPHPEFGDPRINVTRWSSFKEVAKNQFIAWLSEEDIRLFFELIIKDDKHERKSFWLQYADKIRTSRVILCGLDLERHQYNLRELKKKGRSFGKIYGQNASAFILNFGNCIAVEFSKKPNACYIYNTNTFMRKVKNIHREEFSMKDLKDKKIALHTQTHYYPNIATWHTELRNVLARQGVRIG